MEKNKEFPKITIIHEIELVDGVIKKDSYKLSVNNKEYSYGQSIYNLSKENLIAIQNEIIKTLTKN